MAQGLYLSQKIALTQMLAPQLQQSLALLQAPTLELKALVEQELQRNPVLEEMQTVEPSAEDGTAGPAEAGPSTAADPAEPPEELSYDPSDEKTSGDPVDDWQVEIERLAQRDQEWRDYFSETNIPSGRPSKDEEEKRQFMLDSLVTTTSLQEILREQVRLSEVPEDQWQTADLIIGNIDDNGYLKASVSELAFSTNTPPERIDQLLKEIQLFDPPGVGARDLRECLMLQLERAGKEKSLEYRVLDQCFKALGKRRMPEIARQLNVPVDQAQQAVQRISHLNPRPGSALATEHQQYVVPEVFVARNGGDFLVSTNNDHLPRLRISNTYKDLLSKAGSSPELRDYLREKIRAGKFLMKSIHQRQETILNIAKEIVARQRDFFERGIGYLKPMTMMQVAEVVGVHETTVSRAVSGKYLQCPQGLIEMKFFFTSGIQTASGSNVSNTTVKDMIAEMVENEEGSKPLSDDQIVRMLKQRDIVIARRTVAKYRSELNILPSHLRRVY